MVTSQQTQNIHQTLTYGSPIVVLYRVPTFRQHCLQVITRHNVSQMFWELKTSLMVSLHFSQDIPNWLYFGIYLHNHMRMFLEHCSEVDSVKGWIDRDAFIQPNRKTRIPHSMYYENIRRTFQTPKHATKNSKECSCGQKNNVPRTS